MNVNSYYYFKTYQNQDVVYKLKMYNSLNFLVKKVLLEDRDMISEILKGIKLDGLVKSRKVPFSVIPAEAGIQ